MGGHAGGLSEGIREVIESHTVFNIDLFGHSVPVTDTVIAMWIIMAAMIIMAFALTRKLTTIPQGIQNIIELIVDGINGFVKGLMHHHWKTFAPYIGTILLFLIFSNIVSIFNIIPFFHLRPPTKNINVTGCMALFSILVVIYAGVRFKNFSGWLKSFVEPMPIILPFKIMEYFIRPLSLALRLFGNILGAFIVMELLYMLSPIPAIYPAFFSIYFDLFDGAIQAAVFVFLTTIYISEAVE